MNFISKIIFQPSFHENLEVVLTERSISLEFVPSLVSIEHLESKEKLTVQEYKQLKEYRIQNKQSEEKRWKEVFDMDFEESSDILSLLKDLANNREVDDRMILDGIIVDCSFSNESFSNEFRFHSPESSMRSYDLANQVVDLCFEKFQSEKAIRAIERVERYFGFHPPWKITSESPLTYRIYGRLSAYDQEAIDTFFESLPKGQKVFMDFRNFEGMGTILYDSFRKLNSSVAEIEWLVEKENDWVIKQLLEIGIEEHAITKK